MEGFWQLIILVFLTFWLASGYFPMTYPGRAQGTHVILGLVATILLFVSVLLHELAHSFVARAHGLPVHSIVLFIFGGVSNDVQATMKAKLNLEFERYTILGACNPQLAHRAQELDHTVGALLLCNVVVHETHDGSSSRQTRIDIADPIAMLGIIDQPAMQILTQ